MRIAKERQRDFHKQHCQESFINQNLTIKQPYKTNGIMKYFHDMSFIATR